MCFGHDRFQHDSTHILLNIVNSLEKKQFSQMNENKLLDIFPARYPYKEIARSDWLLKRAVLSISDHGPGS